MVLLLGNWGLWLARLLKNNRTVKGLYVNVIPRMGW